MALVNKLPTEFIHKVSTYLSLIDNYHCLFVCKLWHDRFQRTVYKSISLQSTEQLASFLNSIEYYGHFVKEIYLTQKEQPKIIEINQDILNKINLYCRFLEVIEFDISQWIHLDLNELPMKWTKLRNCGQMIYNTKTNQILSLFDNLTTIHIEHVPNQIDKLINTLGDMKHSLKDVTLEMIIEDEENNITLDYYYYLKKIHQTLPKIKRLGLIRDKTPKQELTQVNYLTSFEQPSNLESLYLHGHIDSVQWFEFIQINYPKLKQLKLIQLSTSRFGTKWMWQTAFVQLLTNLELNSLILGGRNMPQLFSDSFLKSLKKNNILKNISIDFDTNQAIESCQFLLSIGKYGLNQLNHLKLPVWEQIPGWSGVTNNLFQCHGLISLDLSFLKGSIDQFPFTNFFIDQFLNHLPQLEILVLTGVNLQTNEENPVNVKTKCKLQTLELRQSKIENHEFIFKYFSNCCSKLNQIILKRCETEKKRINLSGLLNAFTMDLRNNELNTLILSTLLIYVGTIQYNKFIGIRLITEKEEKIIWCDSKKFMIYPIYFLNENQEENQQLDQLYQSYTESIPLSNYMPGNYTPSIGVITIYCKSINHIYLDHLKIK